MDEIWRDLKSILALINRMSKYRETEIEHIEEMVLLMGTVKINVDEIYEVLLMLKENRNG